MRVCFYFFMRYNSHDMKLESNGILIDLRPIGERDSIARVFTSEFGVMCGVMRAAQIARKNKPLVGQVGCATWNARLDSQLGTFHWESEKNLAVELMRSQKLLAMMNSAFALITVLLPEREQYPTLYSATVDLMRNLGVGKNVDAYLEWETELLRDLGYGLDLSSCAACGTRDNLVYVSPRTGRAVCAKCGAPYDDKMYRLPLNLDITRLFIERICMAQGTDLPIARKRLISE